MPVPVPVPVPVRLELVSLDDSEEEEEEEDEVCARGSSRLVGILLVLDCSRVRDGDCGTNRRAVVTTADERGNPSK